MINRNSVRSVGKRRLNRRFKTVDNDYNLANIPGTILNNFGVKGKEMLPVDVFGAYAGRYRKVLLMVIDGLGYDFFLKHYRRSRLLRQVYNRGVVSKLSAQFPSTTSVNITTLHSALPVIETGVTEWYYYEPVISGIFNPLIYEKAGSRIQLDVSPDIIFPFSNLYEELSVNSYIFQNELFNNSPYSKRLNSKATPLGFKHYSEGLPRLKEILSKEEEAYCYFYIADFDEAAHRFGPYSKETVKCLTGIFSALDEFYENMDSLPEFLFLLTADHGFTTIKKEQAVYLNVSYPEILTYLKKDKAGNIIAPCGSYRDMFLHVRHEYIDYVYEYLKSMLKHVAYVYKVSDLIQIGLFGKNKPNKRFLDRVGDVAILPYRNQAVWWYEKNKYFVGHNGMHGGLTKEEMEIPFLVFDNKI